MKSRQRPPLNLTAPDEGADTAAREGEATGVSKDTPEPQAQPAAETRTERRKRRQSEQAATV